jgi:hypothetical protein
MAKPKIGQSVTFVDTAGKPHLAVITAVHPAEKGRGAWDGDDGPDEKDHGKIAKFRENDEFELAPDRVDLRYMPGNQDEFADAIALEKFSVLHKAKQTPRTGNRALDPHVGVLGNFWEER